MISSVVAVLLGSTCGPISSSWPIARHDPQRTAYVTGATDISDPGVAWRYYVGGSLQNAGYWAGDVDGSGQTAIVYAGAGRVIAKRPDDTIVWQTSQLFVQSIIDVWDVDGDGILDVVASGSPSTLVIVSGKDGTVEWTMPSSAGIGTIGLVRTVDLNGDGRRDIYVTDCGCCGPTTNGAVAYSFVTGFANTTAPLWAIADISPGACQDFDLITDLNGDGISDVIKLYDSKMVAYSGVTGALEFQFDGVNGDLLSGNGGLVALSAGSSPVVIYDENFYNDSASVGGKRVVAYGYDEATSSIVRRWDYEAGSQPTLDEVSFDSSSLGSFDATGDSEVAFSLYDSTAQAWTLQVVDALSGTLITSLPGPIYQGAADVDGDGISEILATTSGVLTAYKLSNSGALQALGNFSGAVTRQLDRSLAARQATASPVATTSLSKSGQDVILNSGSTPPVYEAVSLASGAGSVLASFQAPTGNAFQGTNLFTDPATQLPQPYLVLSSGYLDVLDPHTFQPTNVDTSPQFPMAGMRTGGFLAPTPVVGKFGKRGSPAVFTPVSEVALVRLDPGQSATPATPPTAAWSIPGLQAPSLVDLSGPDPAIVATDGGEIVAFEGNGQTQVWATTQSMIGDLPFGDANGDGVPDIFYENANPLDGWILNVNVLDGRSGAPLWSTPYTTPVAWGTANLSVGDMDGDGRADAVSVINYVTYLSGATGLPFAISPSFTAYGDGLVADVMDAGTPQVFLNDSYFLSQLDGIDAGTLWALDGGVDERWSPAALAPCASGPIFIEASDSTLHAYSAQTGAEVWREVLASGQSFASAAAVPASTLVGVLGSATVKQDLTGNNHMDALVGSSDGYLYAVQACNGGAIDWAYNFGYPVGEPIVADSRGTGTDQVLVPVADGYLYALDQFAISCPSFATATAANFTARNPWGASGGSGSSLSVEWAVVPGATRYQWAVYTSAGVAVTPFRSDGYFIRSQPGGAVADLTATGIPLSSGGRYYFAIRAVGPNGISGEAISNTVSVTTGTSEGGTSVQRPHIAYRPLELIR